MMSDRDAIKMAQIEGQYGVIDIFFDHSGQGSIF